MFGLAFELTTVKPESVKRMHITLHAVLVCFSISQWHKTTLALVAVLTDPDSCKSFVFAADDSQA